MDFVNNQGGHISTVCNMFQYQKALFERVETETQPKKLAWKMI